MTLNELIETLIEVRDAYPLAGGANVMMFPTTPDCGDVEGAVFVPKDDDGPAYVGLMDH